jgi:organic radical activating enzyme
MADTPDSGAPDSQAASQWNQRNMDRMLARREELNRISPSMCLAKWLQTTTHLQNGFTHSCHHPIAHKIPLSEIKENPRALHNTLFKKEQRRQMLAGSRPSECSYCWTIEDLGKSHISDRTYKSADDVYAWGHREEVVQAGADGDIDPTYFEVSFSNLCNFKCAYCSPDISSKWMEEVRTHGPYPTSTPHNDPAWLAANGKMPIPSTEDNPYVDAFWKWWPELYRKVKVFRITGGEPLLSENTWRLLDWIEKNPKPDVRLAINTNLGVPDKLIDRLIRSCNAIRPKIDRFDIFTSCEATGKQAEYIRFGMDFEKFRANTRKFLLATDPKTRLNFMVTFNLLSVTTFKGFLGEILKLRAEFNESPERNRIPMMISYLRWPTFLDVRNLPFNLKEKYSSEYAELIKSSHGQFYLEEQNQVERLRDYMLKAGADCGDSNANEAVRNRRDFAIFVDEYDRRRGTSFKDVFPELVPYHSLCTSLLR